VGSSVLSRLVVSKVVDARPIERVGRFEAYLGPCGASTKLGPQCSVTSGPASTNRSILSAAESIPSRDIGDSLSFALMLAIGARAKPPSCSTMTSNIFR
jgi:hypothetical protein